MSDSLKLRMGLPAMPSNEVTERPVSFHVVDWLPPDFGAVGQHCVMHARALSLQGVKVCVVGLSSGITNSCEESSPSVNVPEFKRIHAKHYAKQNAFRRLLWSLYTNARLIRGVIGDQRSRGADLLFTGSPPFMLFFALIAKHIRGMKLTYRITDFYPEVLIAAYGRTRVLTILERLTWRLRLRVDEFQVLGEDQKQILEAHGIASKRINLMRDVSPFTITGREATAQIPSELRGYKILLYSGNYGVAHEVETVVQGLMHHHQHGSGQFALWLNASGSSVPRIVDTLKSMNVPVARTEPVSVDNLAGVLLAADALLISLREAFSGYVMPSKVYGCLAARRPIVFVGPRTSDVHLLCQEAKDTAYEHIRPGDAEGFSAALDRLTAYNLG
jgi:hypothetical protein